MENPASRDTMPKSKERVYIETTPFEPNDADGYAKGVIHKVGECSAIVDPVLCKLGVHNV